MKRKGEQWKKKIGYGILLIALTAFLGGAGWIIIIKFERNGPTINFNDFKAIGKTGEITVTVADMQSGLRKIEIILLKDGQRKILESRKFSSSVKRIKLEKEIIPRELGISDGSAILKISAFDYSWKHWWDGNLTEIEKTILIDTRAPNIQFVSQTHNISRGGVGLAVYSLSEDCRRHGVKVGNNFFPGYSAAKLSNNPQTNLYLCFFALDYKQDRKTQISGLAEDTAGNLSEAGFYYYIKNKKFKQDIIGISDRFLAAKMPEFNHFFKSETQGIDQFLLVNRKLRQQNYNAFIEKTAQSDAVMHWSGVFHRLPRASPKAGFADHRKYKYNNKVIDRQVHLGVDLASTAHAPIPASNAGKVIFSDRLGIYGRTVIIDHGLGLFSTYSHLSSFAIQAGQMVTRDQIIGHSGKSGLAGGDHLHFGMLVHNTFVDPKEWWDPTWLKNNINNKINAIKD